MNKERAKELLPVYQAFCDGRAIQCRTSISEPWLDIDDPVVWSRCEWRIKPELHDFNWALRRAVEDGVFSCRDSDPEWLLMNIDGGLQVRRINMRDPASSRFVGKADLDATDWRPVSN